MKRIFLLLIMLAALTIDAYPQWEPCNGLIYRDVKAIIIKDNIIFVGTYGSGVFASTDHGASWVPKNNSLTNTNVVSMAVNGNNMFVSAYDGGVFHSTDNGNSWTEKNNGIESLYIQDLIVFQDNLYLLIQDKGIYFSSDNGSTWSLRNNGMGSNWFKRIDSSNDTLYGGGSGGLYQSVDEGNTWTYLPHGNQSIEYDFEVSGQNIYVLQQSGISVSTDLGNTWDFKEANVAFVTPYFLYQDGNNLIVSSYSGLYLTTDNGIKWEKISNGFVNTYIPSIVFDNNNMYAVTNGGGIYYSSDYGNEWVSINKSLLNLYVNVLKHRGNNLYTGTDRGLFVSADNGKTWHYNNTSFIDAPVSSIELTGEQGIYIGTTNRGVIFSGNDGETFTSMDLHEEQIVSIARNDRYIIAGTESSGLYISGDNGNTWDQKDFGTEYKNIQSIAVKDNMVYVSTGYKHVYYSTDYGDSWAEDLSFAEIDMDINTLISNGDDILAGTISGVYMLEGGSDHWVLKGNGARPYVTALAVKGSIIFAGAGVNDLYISTDYGESWYLNEDGPIYNGIVSLTLSDEYLFAGTQASGIFRAKLSDLVTSVNEDKIPANDLSINIWPNPASDRITISYERLKSQNMNIVLTNSLGMEMMVFGPEEINGQSSIEYSTAELPSGIYNCTIYTGDQRITKKFVVVK